MKIMKKINEIKMEKDKTIMLQASSAKRSVGHSPPGNVQPFTASVYTDALLATKKNYLLFPLRIRTASFTPRSSESSAASRSSFI